MFSLFLYWEEKKEKKEASEYSNHCQWELIHLWVTEDNCCSFKSLSLPEWGGGYRTLWSSPRSEILGFLLILLVHPAAVLNSSPTHHYISLYDYSKGVILQQISSPSSDSNQLPSTAIFEHKAEKTYLVPLPFREDLLWKIALKKSLP